MSGKVSLLLWRYFIKFPVILLISYIIMQTAWENTVLLTHSLLELLCILMALMMFILVWYSFNRMPGYFQIIGFSYLIIAVFLILHSIYLGSPQDGQGTLSLFFIVIARLIEALAFFSLTAVNYPRIPKGTLLFLSLAVCLIPLLLLTGYGDSFPLLFMTDSYQEIVVIANLLILVFLTINLYLINQRVFEKDLVGYSYAYGAVIINIMITMLYFLMYKRPDTYLNIVAHVMRIIFYYHLFRGVFVNAIIYPYEKLEEILNHLPLAVTTYDKDCRFTFANKRAEEVTGYSSQEIQGLTDWDIVQRMYQDKKSPHIIRELSLQQKVGQTVRTLLRKDGSLAKIVLDAYKLQSGGYLCLFDMAKRMQTLENMQLQTQIILDSITNIVLIMDPEGKVIVCNNALSETVEIKKTAIIGMDIKNFLKKIRFSRPELAENDLRETTSSNPLEASIITPQGKKRDLLLHLAFIWSIEKEVMGYMIVGTDVTDLKKQLDEVKQKEKLAILGQMASGIVHEIRNPVTAIMGFNQLLNMTVKDSKVEYFCRHIEGELNRLNKIVSDFLLFARPRSPVFEKISPNQIVESTKLLIDSYVFSKGIKIDYECDREIEPILADKGQLEQVILNIVKNAVDVLEGSENPLIRISTGYDRLFSESYIAIYNNGRALNQEEKQKIGIPFFTTKSKGTGLGLSICKQIISEHGGKMNIKSEEGWGTVFELSFPSRVSDVIAHNGG